TAEVITNARASRITRHRPNRPKIALRLFAHRSEFDDSELPAFVTDPRLTVKDGAPIGQPDCYSDQHQQWREDNRRRTGYGDIDQTFEKSPKASNGLMRAGLRQHERRSSLRSAG